GRRDPALYGGLSLAELETRIYEWATELGCHVRCRQTNSAGEYVAGGHDALDWADGVVAHPGAWTHYSYAIRHALELLDLPRVAAEGADRFRIGIHDVRGLREATQRRARARRTAGPRRVAARGQGRAGARCAPPCLRDRGPRLRAARR